jgi:class 3 adenylate cyclase
MTQPEQLTQASFAAACDEVASAYENGEWGQALSLGRRCCEFAHRHVGAAHPIHRWCLPAECLRTAERASRDPASAEPAIPAEPDSASDSPDRSPADDGEDASTSHRREITVLLAGLRDFSTFAETADPGAVMAILQRFNVEMVELVRRHHGTLERFAADGLRVIFDDPSPSEDHGGHAVTLACAMQARAAQMSHLWKGIHGPSGLGIGMSRGLATIGAIRSGERVAHCAVGSVMTRAARLRDQSRAGQILVCPSLWASLQGRADGSPSGELHLQGFGKAEAAYAIHWDRTLAATPAADAGAAHGDSPRAA